MKVIDYMEGNNFELKGFEPTKYKTAAGMAKALHKAISELCVEWGAKPEIETFIRSPQESRLKGGPNAWHVSWEGGPYQWAVLLSMSEQMFANRKVLAEPQYSFDLCFFQEG